MEESLSQIIYDICVDKLNAAGLLSEDVYTFADGISETAAEEIAWMLEKAFER